MTTFDAHSNFAYSTCLTAPSPASSGTSITVQSADAPSFPDPGSTSPYNIVVWPAGSAPIASNAEICRVTAKVSNTLTIVRNQESSANRSIVVGDQIAMAVTKKTLTDIETQVNNVALTSPIGEVKLWPSRVPPTNFLVLDGSAISRSTYPTLFGIVVPNLGTLTMTIASPAVFTLNAHGFVAGDSVYITSTGSLPTGVTQNTLYYVISAGLATNTFELATTPGGAAINTSGSQSGTHTLWHCPYGLGDGTTTFNLPDGRGRGVAGLSVAGHADVAYLGATEGVVLGSRRPAHTHTVSGGVTGILTPSYDGSYHRDIPSYGGAGNNTNGQQPPAVGPQTNAPVDEAAFFVMNYIIRAL